MGIETSGAGAYCPHSWERGSTIVSAPLKSNRTIPGETPATAPPLDLRPVFSTRRPPHLPGFTHEVPGVECYACLGNCESPLALTGAVVSKPRGVIAERVQLPG